MPKTQKLTILFFTAASVLQEPPHNLRSVRGFTLNTVMRPEMFSAGTVNCDHEFPNNLDYWCAHSNWMTVNDCDCPRMPQPPTESFAGKCFSLKPPFTELA